MFRRFFHSLGFSLFLSVFLFPLHAFAGENDVDDISLTVEQILREASGEVENISVKAFENPSPGTIRYQPKIILYIDIAKVQAKIRDKRGLGITANRAQKVAHQDASIAYWLYEIANAQFMAGYVNAAEVTVKEAVKVTYSLKATTARETRLAILAPFLAQVGDIVTAVDIAKATMNAQTKTHTFLRIGSVLAQQGQHKKVLAVLTQAIESAMSLEDLWNQADHLRRIASMYVGIDKRAEADTLLQTARNITGGMSFIPNKIGILVELAGAENRFGHPQTAKKWMKEVQALAEVVDDPFSQIDQFCEIGVGLTKMGEDRKGAQWLERATTMVESLKISDLKGWGFRRIADAYKEIGHTKAAQTMYLQSARVAQAFTHDGQKLLYLVLAMREIEKIGGLSSEELQELHTMVESIQINDADDFYLVSDKASILGALAVLHVQADRTDEAKATLDRIHSAPLVKASVIQKIMKAMVQNDRKKMAWNFVRQLTSSLDKVRALLGVAEGMVSISEG